MSHNAGPGLMGIELQQGDPDDPILITSAVLNQPVVAASHVDKDRREDLELWSALHALAYHGVGRHPLGVLVRADPNDSPDRTLVSGDRTWGAELTQLTVTSAAPPTPRQQMAQAVKFRDRLQQRIESYPTTYAHLAGRAVTIQKKVTIPTTSADTLPKKDGPLLEQIAGALKQDRGVMSFDQASGTIGQGMYGSHGPLEVAVQAVPGITGFAIYMAYDFPVRRSEALAAFAERVAAKDEPGNDIVIVTCGVPDEHGWASASDHALYLHLLVTYQSGAYILPKKPTHIRGLLIHQSPDSPELLLLANDDDDLPWQVSPDPGTFAGRPTGPRFRRPVT